MANLVRQVGQSSDDAYRPLVGGSGFDLAGSDSIVGYFGAGNLQYGCGIRFTNITIPKGSIITEAHLTLRARENDATAGVNSRISAEDVDNAPTFADSAAAYDTRYAARTTARVDWDNIAAWTAGLDYDSVDIKSVIQEIIDRVAWASGNAIAIFWEDYDDRSTHAADRLRNAQSYDGQSANAPKLDISFLVQGVWGFSTWA